MLDEEEGEDEKPKSLLTFRTANLFDKPLRLRLKAGIQQKVLHPGIPLACGRGTG